MSRKATGLCSWRRIARCRRSYLNANVFTFVSTNRKTLELSRHMNKRTTVIHHSADFDGLFCREIARKFLPDAELIGWDYGDPLIPFPAEGIVYVLDLSPDCFERQQVEAYEAQRLIWIDHHKSAIDKFNPQIPGYRIDGVAACRLAWQWFTNFDNRPCTCEVPHREGHYDYCLKKVLSVKEEFIYRKVSEPLAVRLAGEYDIWDKRDPDAETFQFGLRSIELTPLHWAQLLNSNPKVNLLVDSLLSSGELLQRYQREQDASIVKRGFTQKFEGLNFLCLNIARCNSLTFESAAQPEHDGLMGFYWNGKEWVVSLYHSPHHREHDLSAIAVKFGGGGHRGACGFRTGKLPFLP